MTRNRYNSRRGNHAEDRDLRNLTEFLLTTTVNRRRDTEDGAIESHPCLPSRCIMVTDDGNNPTAKLVETNGDRAPYIVLSHTWDRETSNFRLKTSNLKKHKHENWTNFKKRTTKISIFPRIGGMLSSLLQSMDGRLESASLLACMRTNWG